MLNTWTVIALNKYEHNVIFNLFVSVQASGPYSHDPEQIPKTLLRHGEGRKVRCRKGNLLGAR